MRTWFLAVASLLFGCSHTPITAAELDRVNRPAFVARFEDESGPSVRVFRDDSHWMDELRKKGSKLSASEADEKLAEHLTHGNWRGTGASKEFLPTITRFEVSDGTRANTFALLPKEMPWTNTVPPGVVSRTLESLLTQEVPARPPDVELLKPLGVDAVVEIVIESYGMRSENGRAGCFLSGYGRMFMIEGGGNMWYRSFRADEVASGQDSVDPFAVNKDPRVFRAHMSALIKAVGEQFAQDLQPPRGETARPERKARPEHEEAAQPEQKGSGEDLP